MTAPTPPTRDRLNELAVRLASPRAAVVAVIHEDVRLALDAGREALREAHRLGELVQQLAPAAPSGEQPTTEPVGEVDRG